MLDVTAPETPSAPTPTTTPDRIMEIGFAFWPSRTLLTAVELDLFSLLGDAALTRAEIEDALELRSAHGADFLDGLVALRVLDRDGDGETARYRNTAESAAFLDKSSPAYLGGVLEMGATRMYDNWAGLTEALRTGMPQNETKNGETPLFEKLYSDPAKLEEFMAAMAGTSKPRFAALAEKFDFSRYGSVADIGGAAGDLSIALANAHPLPRADVVTMGMILHDWNLEKKMSLIRAAYDALPEGGAFIVLEALIDDARRENVFGLMMSLNMLVELGDAFDYTGADFDGWCREAGFRRTEVISLVGPASAAVAYK